MGDFKLSMQKMESNAGHKIRSAAGGGGSEDVVAQRSKKSSTNGCADFFGNRKRAKAFIHVRSGGLAQLVERLLRKQEVTGSNPVISTNNNNTHPSGWVLLLSDRRDGGIRRVRC